jgi:hypothetical protein
MIIRIKSPEFSALQLVLSNPDLAYIIPKSADHADSISITSVASLRLDTPRLAKLILSATNYQAIDYTRCWA